MTPGDILRLRNMRVYNPDPRNYVEFTPDQERKASLKRVFVCLLLGTEGFEILDKTGKQVMEPLDAKKALNRLGWYSVDQLKAAGVSEDAIVKANKT